MASTKYPESGGAYRNARAVARPRISQKSLAEEVGVDTRTIMRYEHGETRPSPAIRDQIAQVLGIDPAALPARGEDPFPASPKTIRSRGGFAQRLGGLLLGRSQ